MKVKFETSNAQISERYRNLLQTKAAEVKRSSRRNRRSYYHRNADKAEQTARRNDQKKLFKMAKELGAVN